MSSCARCQRSDDPADWSKRAEVSSYGLGLCYPHDLALRSDMDRLAALDATDPERAHGLIDDILLKWAPRSLADAAEEAIKRQPWWGAA